MNKKKCLLSQYYRTDKEIIQYYGQIWDNVKHMTEFVKALREQYFYVEIGGKYD